MANRFFKLFLTASLAICLSGVHGRNVQLSAPQERNRLPSKVLGMYVLLADDTEDGFHSDDDWEPKLFEYQQKGANVLFFTFINPDTMEGATCFPKVSCHQRDWSWGGSACRHQSHFCHWWLLIQVRLSTTDKVTLKIKIFWSWAGQATFFSKELFTIISRALQVKSVVDIE